MGLFKKLFGSKKQSPPLPETDTAFEADFDEALQRYFSMPGARFEHEFTDDNGNVLTVTEAFPAVYQEWKGIRSVWDKRSLLYKTFDDIYGKRLKLWQAMERFTTDRYPDRALALAGKHATPADFQDVDFLVALARCHQMLAEYEKGTEYAEQAIAKEKGSKKAQLALADLYHLAGRHDEAHQLYAQVLEESKLKTLSDTTLDARHLVGFHYDIIPSPVYAVGLLQSGEADEHTWDVIAGEFYYSPYFRCQHAFFLIQKKENLKGLAKLVSLSQEFPWYREGVVNAYEVIQQFRQQMGRPDFMEEEEKYLKKILDNPEGQAAP